MSKSNKKRVTAEQEAIAADEALVALQPQIAAAQTKLDEARALVEHANSVAEEAKANWDKLESGPIREAEERVKKAQAALRGPLWKRVIGKKHHG